MEKKIEAAPIVRDAEGWYEVIGRILHKDSQYALFDSSCRWLTSEQYQRLMHEQDGSLFAAPAAQGDAKDAERMDFLVKHIVEVRAEQRYGSKFLFISQAKYDEDEFTGTTLREQIDAAIAASKAAS